MTCPFEFAGSEFRFPFLLNQDSDSTGTRDSRRLEQRAHQPVPLQRHYRTCLVGVNITVGRLLTN
jgi:hypothetical protein